MIDDLLDLQRLESGCCNLVSEPIFLPFWISQLTKPFLVRAQERQQELQIYIEEDLFLIHSDPTSLERVLGELLNNACKYSPPGAQIQLSITAPSSTQFLLCVSNTGVEIPMDEQSRIFDKFYRIPSGDPWKQGGTGLGLTLVQKLVESLKGEINVESGAGMTSFRINFSK